MALNGLICAYLLTVVKCRSETTHSLPHSLQENTLATISNEVHRFPLGGCEKIVDDAILRPTDD